MNWVTSEPVSLILVTYRVLEPNPGSSSYGRLYSQIWYISIAIVDHFAFFWSYWVQDEDQDGKGLDMTWTHLIVFTIF